MITPTLIRIAVYTANSLFVRDKYVTPTGKRLHAGYVPFDTTARNKQHVLTSALFRLLWRRKLFSNLRAIPELIVWGWREAMRLPQITPSI